MTYFASNLTEYKNSRRNTSVFTASVSMNTPDHFWEDKIIIHASTKEETIALQNIIVEAVNNYSLPKQIS